MNDKIKNEGWRQMDAILAKELPVQKKKNRAAGWLLLAAVWIGFVLGYISHGIKPTTLPDSLPESKIQQDQVNAETTISKSVSLPPDISKNQTVRVPKMQSPEKSFAKTNKETQFQNVQNTIFVHQQHREEKQNPVPSNQTVEEDISPDMMHHQNQTAFHEPVFCPTLAGAITSSLPKEVNTAAIVQTTKSWVPCNRLSLALGSHFQKPVSYTAGIHYHYAWKKDNAYIFTGLGYRFVRYSIAEALDTIKYALVNSPTSQNEGLWSQQKTLELGHVHQIIPSIGFGYCIDKTWYAEIGLQFPCNLSFANTQADNALEDKEDMESEFSHPFPSASRDQNYWDVQTCFSVGKRLNNSLGLMSSFSLGFKPINAKPLQSGKDLKFNQCTIGLSYTF